MKADRSNARSALGADRMMRYLPGERSGSRPKPPQAVARSASLEPGRSPGYPFIFTVAHPKSFSALEGGATVFGVKRFAMGVGL